MDNNISNKYINFSPTGSLDTRYIDDPEYHAGQIPETAVNVTEELFWQTINETDGIWTLVEGNVVKLPLPEPVPPTFTEQVTTKLADIKANYELAMANITKDYSDSELLSWTKQEQEARLLLNADANSVVETPLISAMATARGLDVEELALRIITKADQFAVFSGTLIGKRQGLEDAITALVDNVELSDADKEAQLSEITW